MHSFMGVRVFKGSPLLDSVCAALVPMQLLSVSAPPEHTDFDWMRPLNAAALEEFLCTQ